MSDTTKRRTHHISTITDITLLNEVFKEETASATANNERLKERYVRHTKISDLSDLECVYQIGPEIGRGSFGRVLSITDKQTNTQWAMKVISKTKAGSNIKSVQQEIHILKRVTHPHIIHLERIYETASKIFLILELCHGVLLKLFYDKKVFTEEETQKVVTELTSAVAYLHRNDIVHRDLKLENILLAKNPEDETDLLYIKVTDFGLGAIKAGSRYDEMFHECCGTLIYMSPEVITTHSYSQQCDIWAIGVITYLLITGKFPFHAKKQTELADKICTTEPDYSKVKASPEALHLIMKTLEKNPALRITAVEMEHHAWIVGKKLNEASSPENVIEMMQMWKTDMQLPGVESDWLLAAARPTTSSGLVITSNNDGVSEQRNPQRKASVMPSQRKESIPIAIHNIEFDRAGHQTITVEKVNTTNKEAIPQTSKVSPSKNNLPASKRRESVVPKTTKGGLTKQQHPVRK